MNTGIIEWSGKTARPKYPLDGAELALLASLMAAAGGRWSSDCWLFEEDAFTAFHRVPNGCIYDVSPSPYVQHIGAL